MKNLFTVLIILSLLSSSPAQEIVDRILAVVDDDIILESEVLQFAQSLALQERADPMKYIQDEELKKRILSELIDQKVLLTRALIDSIIVEDREVDRELESRLSNLIEQVGSEEELEKVYGSPIREIRRDLETYLRDGLIVEKYKQKKLSGVKVSRAEVEDFYQQYKEQLSDRPESVDLAHILLKIKPSPDADARAKSLIDSLYQAISQGADFARTAELFSQDPGSAKRGGALGWAKRGDFVPEFESVAFNLEAGKFSEPIKSRFGYHLILLNDRQGEKINLSHILVKLTPSNDDRQRTLSLADSLFTLLLNGADFAQLAQQYSDDEESRAEGGHIGTFAVKDLIPLYAKAIEGLPPGTFTQPLKSDLGMQIVKVIDRTKERPLTLENDWEAIAQITLNQKKEKVYRQWVDELIKDVYVDIKGVK